MTFTLKSLSAHSSPLWCAVMIQTCLFSQTLQHEYEWKENSLFWPETCLLRRKKFHRRSPHHTHSVWSGALIKQQKKKKKKKKEHFYISNSLHFQKLHCLRAMPCTGAGRQRTAQGEMTQVTNGWWGICSAWKPIITGNARISEPHHEPIKTWPWVSALGAGYVRDAFCIICWMTEENAAGDPEWSCSQIN